MLDPKPIAAAIVAAVILNLAIVSQASAGWRIEGSELSGTAALATTAAVTESFKLKAAGVTVTCSGSTLSSVGPEIRSPNKLAASSLTFSECSANETCKVTKTIGTVPLSAELTEQTSPEDKATFLPKTKTILATISYQGETCALLGVQPLKGEVKASMPTEQEENGSQLLKVNISEASNILKVGSSAAEFLGIASLGLASKEEYSETAQAGLVAVSSEIRIALSKGEENKKVVVVFENSNAAQITIKKNAVLGGDGVSWKINPAAEQEAGYCKMGQVVLGMGHCTVTTTFNAGMKAKKEGAGNGYVATLTENANIGGATVKLNGEVTN